MKIYNVLNELISLFGLGKYKLEKNRVKKDGLVGKIVAIGMGKWNEQREWETFNYGVILEDKKGVYGFNADELELI